MTRFTNPEDYEHVLTKGLYMPLDNYVAIWDREQNFVPEEDTTTKLTWVRIPCLGVEYFNKNFLMEKITRKLER